MKDNASLSHKKFQSLEEFADYISTMLGGPVTIEDAGHRLLAYSMHSDYSDEARVSTIMSRRVPENVVNKLWKEGVIPALHKEQEPVVISSIQDIGLGNRMAIAIRRKQEIMGYIWVIEGNNAFSPVQEKLLKTAAEKAAKELQQRHMQNKQQEKSKEEFFWRLLTEDIKEISAITKQFERWHGKAPVRPLIIVLESEESIDDIMFRSVMYLVRGSQKVKLWLQTRTDNQVIMLIEPAAGSSCNTEQHFMDELLQLLKDRFTSRQFIGSGREAALSYLKKSYEEAQVVIRMQRRLSWTEQHLYTFEQLGYLKYLEAATEEHAEDAGRIHPVIDKLIIYDKKNNTDLINTLYIFLQSCSMNKAAEMMHIHANTMAYRMKRIEEITDMNTKNPHEQLSLLMEFALREYISS